MSHIYGKSANAKASLRSFKKGKLKTRIFKREEYPPFLTDCQQIWVEHQLADPNSLTHEPLWAIGNLALGVNPLLFVFSTIWLREHNRVCNILYRERPNATDEELYQTARLIITGELIKITLTEYLQHMSGYPIKFIYSPILAADIKRKDFEAVHQDFVLLPHWHPHIPNRILIKNETYRMEDLISKNNKIVFNAGLEKIINAMGTQPAGEFTAHNIGRFEEENFKRLIELTRKMKCQSFNNYKRKFAMKPLSSFDELTDNVLLIIKLRELYVDIEALELPVGLLVESKNKGVVPPSMSTMASAWFIKTLLSHPIHLPSMWQSKNFGGSTGMDIVKSATLRKLFCLNLVSNCNDLHIDFTTPRGS